MSTISKLIFNGAGHKVTSPYGKRAVISTSGGNTSSFHQGTDYASTTSKKALPQYAIEDGYVFAAAKASDGANYVWVIYPRIKLAMLHYHLSSYNVKAGQKVTKGTKLGITGKTGKATGIHLHLGIRDLSNLTTAQVNSMTWALLKKCSYVDPEKVKYSAKSETKAETKSTGVAKSKDEALAGTYKVTASSGLNIRNGAGMSYTSIGVLKHGATVQCYGYYSEVKSTKWLYVVATVNGKSVEGFCSSAYLSK